MIPQWTIEVGSLLAFIAILAIAVDNRRNTAKAKADIVAIAREKAVTGDKLLQEIKAKVETSERACLQRDNAISNIEGVLNNGLIKKIDKLAEDNTKSHGDIWSALTDVKVDIGELKGSK